MGQGGRLSGPQWFVAGVTLGALVAGLVPMGFYSEVTDGAKANWATLASGLLALIGAFTALAGVREQVAQQERLAEQNRKSDLAAARALLPLILSEFHQKSERAILLLVEAPQRGPRLAQVEALAEISQVTSDQMQILKECIKSSDPQSASWLALIIKNFQVCCARSEGFLTGVPLADEDNRKRYIINWCELKAVVAHCFAFARGDANTIDKKMPSSKIRVPFGVHQKKSALFRDLEQEIKDMAEEFIEGRSSKDF